MKMILIELRKSDRLLPGASDIKPGGNPQARALVNALASLEGTGDAKHLL